VLGFQDGSFDIVAHDGTFQFTQKNKAGGSITAISGSVTESTTHGNIMTVHVCYAAGGTQSDGAASMSVYVYQMTEGTKLKLLASTTDLISHGQIWLSTQTFAVGQEALVTVVTAQPDEMDPHAPALWCIHVTPDDLGVIVTPFKLPDPGQNLLHLVVDIGTLTHTNQGGVSPCRGFDFDVHCLYESSVDVVHFSSVQQTVLEVVTSFSPFAVFSNGKLPPSRSPDYIDVLGTCAAVGLLHTPLEKALASGVEGWTEIIAEDHAVSSAQDSYNSMLSAAELGWACLPLLEMLGHLGLVR
jgi:hypothetical protein